MKSNLLFDTLLVMCVLTSHGTRALDAISTSDCSKSKSCMRNPDRCSGSDCTFFVSWKPVEISGSTYVEFELAGSVESAGYIAVGFSKDKRMGQDGVIGCIAGAGAVTIRTAYNPGYSNTFITAPAGHLLSSSGSLLGGSFKAADNFLSCRFRRPAKPSTNDAQLMDLSSPNKYFVLVSRGKRTGATGLGKHFDGGIVVSRASYDLTSKTFITVDGAVVNLVKVHAALMMIAWMWMSSIGVIMARSFKWMWPNRKWCEQKVWFQLHRGLQISCVICTCISFILIFVHVGGYSQITVLPGAAHPILGIIVTVLALANPMIALFRCTPDDKKRPIFNWTHFAVGTLAQIFALTAIFIGVKMPPVGANFANADYPFWILIGFIVFVAVMDIALYLNSSRKKKELFKGDNENDKSSKNVQLIHKILLGLYVLGVTGFTIPLVILMIIN